MIWRVISRLFGRNKLAPGETGARAWRYAVPCRNAAGEIVVLVALSQDERADASAHFAPVGGCEGLIVRGYALRRASRMAPGGFIPVVEGVEFASLH
jgi:hypothetical protein